MSARQITVTVESSLGADSPLTVKDGLGQILDFFELMTVAGDHFSQNVGWSLVSVSKNSPLMATGEAFSVVPDVSIDEAAKHIKYFVADAINAITSGLNAPDWMSESARNKTRALLRRNTNGVGKTNIEFYGNNPPSVIVERTARVAIDSLNRSSLLALTQQEDLSHSALGSTEGVLEGLTTYHGKPAVRMRDRVSGRHIACVLSDVLTKDVGRQRVWQEVWTGRRVRAVGRLFYKSDGMIARIMAEDLISVEPGPMKDKDLLPALADGVTPSDYLRQLWSGDNE